jgi:glutamate N-acetyltransferase / amino-acid N-acetyltransferase
VNHPSDSHTLKPADAGVTAPQGFVASAVAAGLKPGGALDVALVVAPAGAVPAAAVFTTNKVAAAPVVVSRRHVAGGTARAVVINAGNANACTGAQGIADTETTASTLARLLGGAPSEVVVSSTGVIGVPLPVDRLLAALPAAVQGLSAVGGPDAAKAIMTTDTVVKEAAAEVVANGRTYMVGGMAKGSGMIAPNMATMLAVITTDAPLTSAACDAVLRSAVRTTFNRVTVDTDTSTNDMAVLMASGAAGGPMIDAENPSLAPVRAAVHVVCETLARMIARDGEGATKLITVSVRGAASEPDAELAAFAIAGSPLVKTAIFGLDANWGRVAMAIGKSGCALDPDAFDITFAGIVVCRAGAAVPFDEDAALEALSGIEVTIDVDLHLGDGSAMVWACDLTYDYVRINGEYRS